MARKVMIGTPSIDGKLDARYVASLLATQTQMHELGIRLEVQMLLQSSLIMEARNAILAAFIVSEADDLVFVDADIGWRAEQFLRLLSHDVSLVAAVYRKKIDAVAFTVGFVDPANVQRDRASGLIEAAHVGGGFMRIRRDCAEGMTAAYPQFRYRDRQEDAKGELVAVFDTSLVEGTLRGEDYTFCDRWRAIGGRVWVDPEIALKHIGAREYEGSLMDSLAPHARP